MDGGPDGDPGRRAGWSLESYSGGTEVVRFPSRLDMVYRSSATYQSLPHGYDGTGHVVYDGHLYYNETNSNNIRKVDLSTMDDVASARSRTRIPQRLPVRMGRLQDIDLAVDEQGLWVIYATAANSGRLCPQQDRCGYVLDHRHLEHELDRSRPSAMLWMVCGKLYATDSFSASHASVNFKFDPATGEESSTDMYVMNPGGITCSIDYNPHTKTLYSWDGSRRLTYNLIF